ncbi:MAG: polyprenyl synthetase family protein, partial [Candidatus Zixiibacteriota bacterium]
MHLMTVEGKTYLDDKKKMVDQLLDKYLPPENTAPISLHSAMRYSIMAGGKRIRPILCFASYEYCNGDMDNLEPVYLAMAALEMVHTYSLIHDDLPCMDDDDLRRGMLTCHKKFGEAIAVLAGDALHDIAFELVAKSGSNESVMELAKSTGTMGMIGGQVGDVEAEGRDVDRAEIISIHLRKTAALIRASVRIGAILAKADSLTFDDLSLYGEKIGLAFQIIDDILDIEGTEDLLGKPIGADSKRGKATYPGVVGMDRAKRDALELTEESL